MQPIYAVGDIHGHLDKLDEALRRIEADGGSEAEVVFLGDLVDRGPDSRGVIQRLIDGQAKGRNWRVLLGNHDRFLRDFLRDDPRPDLHLKVGMHWLASALGGRETLASYGVSVNGDMRLQEVHEAALAAVPEDHVRFLNDLALYHEDGARLFVHAGIRPGIPLADQTEDDLVWIRLPFLDHPDPFPWLVVHGHTALDHPRHFGNRIDLDGGAAYGGELFPARFDGLDCTLLLESGDRVPLVA